MALERESEEPYFAFGMALVNALVLSKIILIGELAKLCAKAEKRPLLTVTIYKSAVFTVLYLCFQLLETGIRGVFHGEPFLHAVLAHEFIRSGGLGTRTLMVFFAFIPFFALMELRRVLGGERFRQFFLGTRRGCLSHEGGEGTQPQPGLVR